MHERDETGEQRSHMTKLVQEIPLKDVNWQASQRSAYFLTFLNLLLIDIAGSLHAIGNNGPFASSYASRRLYESIAGHLDTVTKSRSYITYCRWIMFPIDYLEQCCRRHQSFSYSVRLLNLRLTQAIWNFFFLKAKISWPEEQICETIFDLLLLFL